jgi:hypothetical protein
MAEKIQWQVRPSVAARLHLCFRSFFLLSCGIKLFTVPRRGDATGTPMGWVIGQRGKADRH